MEKFFIISARNSRGIPWSKLRKYKSKEEAIAKARQYLAETETTLPPDAESLAYEQDSRLCVKAKWFTVFEAVAVIRYPPPPIEEITLDEVKS